MPGVPSGRGCNACRQQKKKCDQSAPACARCTRLGIPCVGGGQRRYKFMHQSQSMALARRDHSRPARDDRSSPSTVPGNELGLMVGEFASALAVTDVRFDLNIYGPFFKDIPRRLGRNKALDASVRALITTLPIVHKHQQSADMLGAYGEALKCVREQLSDPVKAASPDTLCAVYVITVCQGWIGRRDDYLPSYGEAMAYMLNAAVEQNWQESFEINMINTLCMIVVMESFSNSKIKLDPRLWTAAAACGPRTTLHESYHIECLQMRTLVKLSDWSKDVGSHLPEIRSLYHSTLQADLTKIVELISETPMMISDVGVPTTEHLPVLARQIHVRRQTCYGILLMLALMLNSVLLTEEPSNADLERDAATYVDEVIALARQAEQYRPLGSSATPLYLIAAWTATNDPVKLAHLKTMITAFETDFASACWMEKALALRPKQLERQIACW